MKVLIWAAVVALFVFTAIAVWMRVVPDDATTWHVDPTTIERTGKPNDYLVAPEGTTVAAPDAVSPTFELEPSETLFLFDSIASNASRVRVVDGSLGDRNMTYVQRTGIFGFPDYISVKAVSIGEGRSALVIWSRSRYGYSDMGVNRDRVTEWLRKVRSSD